MNTSPHWSDVTHEYSDTVTTPTTIPKPQYWPPDPMYPPTQWRHPTVPPPPHPPYYPVPPGYHWELVPDNPNRGFYCEKVVLTHSDSGSTVDLHGFGSVSDGENID